MKAINFSNKFTKKNDSYDNLRNIFSKIYVNHNLIYVLLAFFFITIPVKNNLNSISIIILLGYSLLKYKDFNFKKFLKFYPFYIYYFMVCFSIFYTANIENGFKYYLSQVPFLIFPFIFSTITINEKRLLKIVRIYIYWICLLILYSEFSTILGLLANGDSLFLLFRKDYSYINLANKINIHPPYIMLQIAFCVIYLISNFTKSGINRFLSLGIIFLLFFYSVHLSSRLPLASLVFVSIILSYLKLKEHYGKVKTIVSLILLSLLFSLILYHVRSTRYRFQELIGMQYANGVYIKSGGSKLIQWESAIEANKNYIFGNGIGDTNKNIIDSNYKNNLLKSAELKYNAHNQYIQSYVGMGVIGLIIVLLILYSSFIPTSKNILNLTAKAFVIYLSFVFMTESYLERHHGIMFISFILCLFNFKKED